MTEFVWTAFVFLLALWIGVRWNLKYIGKLERQNKELKMFLEANGNQIRRLRKELASQNALITDRLKPRATVALG